MVPPSPPPASQNCASKESDLYLGKLDELSSQQQQYNALWTECQRCQGSFSQEVGVDQGMGMDMNMYGYGMYLGMGMDGWVFSSPIHTTGDLLEPRLPHLL
ncbi:hypothetical protein EON63_05415 [archaeon]|nr:MAG: hypothetical protein EON63_05415 [archaeon]